MRTSRLNWLVWLVLLLGLALMNAPSAWAEVNLSSTPAGGGPACSLKPGKTCFHVFTSTHTETTGNSVLFQVNMCSVLTYYFKADGAASMKMRETGTNSKTGATVFAPDWDGDGRTTGIDEDFLISDRVGRRSFSMRPRAPWQYGDVIVPPSTGSAVLSITCQ